MAVPSPQPKAWIRILACPVRDLRRPPIDDDRAAVPTWTAGAPCETVTVKDTEFEEVWKRYTERGWTVTVQAVAPMQP